MMMVNRAVIAKRYAQAFLNVYGANITHDVFLQLQKILKFFDENKWYLFLLKVPVLDPEKKKKSVDDLLIGRFELPEYFKTITNLLCKEGRLSLIGDVIDQISSLYLVVTDTHAFVVSSSCQLTQEEKKEIESFLARQLKRVIIKEYIQDTNLIAGIRMQSDTYLWEYSIDKQLVSFADNIGLRRKE